MAGEPLQNMPPPAWTAELFEIVQFVMEGDAPEIPPPEMKTELSMMVQSLIAADWHEIPPPWPSCQDIDHAELFEIRQLRMAGEPQEIPPP